MRNVLDTRLMIWKKQIISLLFWLFLPLVGLSFFLLVDTNDSQNIRIPVGIVVEEQTPLLDEVIQNIDELPMVDLLYLSYDEAMHQLEIHQLDSVFAFPKGYDASIMENDRRGIVSHYTSNLSIAAIPMKESVLSLIQSQLNRSEAAHTVEELFNAYGETPPTHEQVRETSIEIQANEQLIETSFTALGDSTTPLDEEPFISVWDVLIFLVLFSTIMLLDWVVRERNHPTFERIIFSVYKPKLYILMHLVLYLCLFVLVDGLALIMLTVLSSKTLSFSLVMASFSFRVMCTIGLFLFALCFTKRFAYLLGAIALFVILIGTSGMIIPVDGILRHMPSYGTLHPLQSVLSETNSAIWLVICVGLAIIWYYRKENKYARRT